MDAHQPNLWRKSTKKKGAKEIIVLEIQVRVSCGEIRGGGGGGGGGGNTETNQTRTIEKSKVFCNFTEKKKKKRKWAGQNTEWMTRDGLKESGNGKQVNKKKKKKNSGKTLKNMAK